MIILKIIGIIAIVIAVLTGQRTDVRQIRRINEYEVI